MGNTPSNSSQTKLDSTAYHEAGHAVVAVVQGLTNISVTIKPGEDSLGECIHPGVFGYEYGGKRERKRIVREYIIVSYAGFQAEINFNREAEQWRSQGDENNALNLSREFSSVLPKQISSVGDEAHMKFLGKLQREARKLVRQHWRSVSAVARELLKTKTLSGDQIKEILRPLNSV